MRPRLKTRSHRPPHIIHRAAWRGGMEGPVQSAVLRRRPRRRRPGGAPAAEEQQPQQRCCLGPSSPRAAVALALALLVLALGATLVEAGAALSSSASPSRSPRSRLPLLSPQQSHHQPPRSPWGALGRARGGATAAAASIAPPGFFTIAERFQALATREDGSADEEQEGEGEGEDGAKAAAASAKRKGPSRQERALRAALQYSVVAIVGPQASGKSTLLNALFGTRFPVLDAKATGIQRTTRGVWVDLSSCGVAASSSASPLVVLDTEGLESVARGVEGSGLFDRQVSTLAVAAADVILLNLWARDVRGGRLGGEKGKGEEGAGLHAELLRALVQTAAAGQGVPGTKAVGRAVSLVVVLRDSEHESGDLAVARDAVRRALQEAAEALGMASAAAAAASRKGKKGGGEGEQQVMVVAGVRVAFAALPSRAFQQAEFEAAAAGLRDRLMGSVLPTLSMEDASHRLQPVPLPRFPSFAEQLWSSIVSETGGIVGGEGFTTTGQPPSKKGKGSDKEERRRRAEEQEQVRAFVRRKAIESCCLEAEPAAGRLERKVEAATEMPILEFGRDAEAILTAARRTLRGRLSSSSLSKEGGKGDAVAEAEAEAVAALGRRLEPCFRHHVEALGDFYFGKFQDKFLGMYHPAPRLEKEARALVKDVLGAFDRAAAAAVPPDMKESWSVEATRARLRDEMDLEVADRRMEVEVLFPTADELNAASLGRRFFLRPSWWRKVALKALVIYVNYLQTVQAAQSLARAARRRQEKYPPMPLF